MNARFKYLIVPFVLLTLGPFATSGAYSEEGKVGERPYEMVWAGRDKEVRDALVDFEDLSGWKVETVNAVATFERSREEQMYGTYVGKLTYRKGDGSEAPQVDVKAPSPIPVKEKGFDTISCWIVGNNWAWAPDPNTPNVSVQALFQNANGDEYAVDLAWINWQEWFLCYRKLDANLLRNLGDSPSFVGFRILRGTNTEDRTLYFDSFCAFKEELKPLEFKLRAKPGIDLFEGQPLGINSGEGRLPFPTNEDTILPASSKNLQKGAFHFYGDSCDFVYEGSDGTLVYTYKPEKGTFTDVSARWNNSAPFYPCAEGGATTLVGQDGAIEQVENAQLDKFEEFKEGVRAIWTLSSKTTSTTVEHRLQLKGKSLIIDTIALGGNVPSVSLGKLDKIAEPRVFAIPYYLYDYGQRPGAALFHPLDSSANLFASAHIDWYRSGASYLQGRHGIDSYVQDVTTDALGAKKTERQTFQYAYLNGSADYRTKTDGKRNDVYERFIFTISPDFVETLPTIANPESPYRSVAGSGVWRAHGASTRDGDKKYWRDVWRHGMRHMIITDHEVCWRDGGESFTFRTKPAPKKGGDAGWIDYSRFMQDTLGFVYGPYNNFTDFSPVNEYWSPDMVNRQQDGTLQPAWARCYAPKPTRAVEYCEKLTPINQEKFHFSCAYCDVHSSVPAWTRTDYDARVPGAGTFMSVFYPYGEIFLLQKKNWKGPTYSEGPHHCFYAGLTDGNYAQDQPYNLFKNQWLLEFDLLKIHEKEVDFGMGNLGMFAPGYNPKDDGEKSAFLDRFLAATLAFGHSGFFAVDYGMYYGMRSYFMVQQIASRYTQSLVDTIRYFDANGTALDVSAALVADCVKRNQVYVKYQDGTVVVSNGSNDSPLNATVEGRAIHLPPNGYTAWTADSAILVESFLSSSGARFDYCESPEYIYIDGRGTWTERVKACGFGAGVCLIQADGQYEIIPEGATEPGFKIADPTEEIEAVALDYDRKELGAAKVRRSRGYVFVEPVEGAFSYLLTKKASNSTPVEEWTCARIEVARGEKVTLTRGAESKEITIPTDASPGRLWIEPSEGTWINFEVVEALAKPNFKYDSKTNKLTIGLSTRIPNVEVKSELTIDRQTLKIDAQFKQPNVVKEMEVTFPGPSIEGAPSYVATFAATYSQDVTVKYAYELTFDNSYQFLRFEDYSFGDKTNATSESVKLTPYVQLRGQSATCDFGQTLATFHFEPSVPCGEVSKSVRKLHPPYGGGAGRVFLRYDFTVPKEPVTFRMSIGRQDGSDRGDGIKFQIAVAEFEGDQMVEGTEKTLAEKTLIEFQWEDLEADLSAYAGKKISLLVISDCGDANNTIGDWACAADMRIESLKTALTRTLTSVNVKTDEK